MSDRSAIPIAARADRSVVWSRFTALVAEDGSAAQPALARLSDERVPLRDVADALHCLCVVHGRDAGVIGVAEQRAEAADLRDWFTGAAVAFGAERDWLSRLVAAAGPLPSTPGQTESEAALSVQRHALDTLASSERAGVAVGAAAALIRDWRAVRVVLDRLARRLDLLAPPSRLPSEESARALAARVEVSPVEERGFLFGAQQLLAQQRGLWSLIDARAGARLPA